MSPFVEIGGRAVGEGAPAYVIAEVGVNHDGDADLAHRLVDVAADVGADAVKFQTFDASLLVSDVAETAPYQSDAAGPGRQRAMLDALQLELDVWVELSEHAAERGLHFLSTAFDEPSLDLLDGLGVPVLKVPSGELTNLPFVRELASRGKPLLLSTGMADLAEIAAAVDAAADAPSLCLLHCVTAYPTPINQANLRAITTLQERFGVPVGWSDHTEGSTSAVVALALGARIFEKHLTVNRFMPGPDHAASADPDGLREYVIAIRDAEASLGSGEKVPTPAELENRVHARRSWHATRDLQRGAVLVDADVTALRPAFGIGPDVALVGLRVARDVAAGQPIARDDVESRDP